LRGEGALFYNSSVRRVTMRGLGLEIGLPRGWEDGVMATTRQRGENGVWFEAIGVGIAVVGLSAWVTAGARAGGVVLRGGGQVQGKVVPDPKNPDRVQVWLLQGRNPLSFQKGQVVEVISKASPLDEYIVRRGKVESTATAASQFELGTWCDQNKLPDLAKLH